VVILRVLGLPILIFGEFELDPVRYELRKRGRRVKLQRLPMELLLLLARHPGELMLRGDLSRAWSSEDPAVVGGSINTAVRKIRQALGDHAEHPRFVETVAGKGYRFIAEVSESAQQPVEGCAAPGPATAIGSLAKRRHVPFAKYAIAVLGAAGFGAAVLWIGTRVQAPMRVLPFTELPGSQSTPAFSPDGGRVVFAWADESQGQHLYIKPVTGASEMQLTKSPGLDSNPTWSPDGRLIAFLREDGRRPPELITIPASGGAERKILTFSSQNPSPLSWSADGRALAFADSDPPQASPAIFLASLDSGQQRRLTTPPASSRGDWHPVFSPTGDRLAFVRNAGSLQIGTLYLLPVDRSGAALGEPIPIRTDRRDLRGIAWSADGRSLVCAAAGGLVRIPIGGGTARPLPFLDAVEPAVAPRGDRMVYDRLFEETAIFRVPGPRHSGTISRLIASRRLNGAPKYSPDGTRILFVSERTGFDELWLTDSEGQNARQLTSFGRATLGSPRWSPDGRFIAFDSTAEGPAKIYLMAVGAGTPRRITSGGSSDVRPSWSHDGAWIYFGSNRSGAWEIWKISTQGMTLVQVTHDGGREAFEDADGRFLYYVKAAPTPGIWRIPLSDGPAAPVSDKGVQGQWGIGRRGVYYLNGQDKLEMLEFSTDARVTIPTPGLTLGKGSGGLFGVAPDDSWILVTVRVRSESELSIVDNFR